MEIREGLGTDEQQRSDEVEIAARRVSGGVHYPRSVMRMISNFTSTDRAGNFDST
jgi:hypothetical protein